MINYTRRLVKLADVVSATLLAVAYSTTRAAHGVQIWAQGLTARVHVKALRKHVMVAASANVTAARKLSDMQAYKYQQIDQMNKDISYLKDQQAQVGEQYLVTLEEASNEAKSLGHKL